MRKYLGLTLLIVVTVIAAQCATAATPTQAPAEATATTAPTPLADVATEAATEAPTEAATIAPPQQAGESLLQVVLDRGTLICGINGNLPGFSIIEPDGTISGFDADYCRAVAAALFDDPEAVEFRPLSAQERFTAVQTGEVDVLIRNTTWTISRDSSVGLEFAPTTFYDGQGMMVRTDSGVETLEDLEGASICVQTGTTTELNLADVFRARNINFAPVVSEEFDVAYSQYEEGRCDAVTSDKSQLAAIRTTFANPDEHGILDETMSKEPLGPVSIQGDNTWSDVIKWIVFATFEAAERGVTSENVGDVAETSQDPNVRRLLGVEGELGQGLGVTDGFARRVISHMGNYNEIYDRHLGPGTAFDIPRGPNKVWTEGGLIYSPPFR